MTDTENTTDLIARLRDNATRESRVITSAHEDCAPPETISGWAADEIERLRAEAVEHDTPAWKANTLLNTRCEIAYAALERIIEMGAPLDIRRVAEAALKECADVI